MSSILLIVALLSIGSLAAFAGMLLGMSRLTLLVILLRPSCDRIFDWFKTMMGGDLGPGAAVNLLVLTLGGLAIAKKPKLLVAPPVLAWLAFIASACLSLVFSHDSSMGMRLVQNLLTYAAVFILPFALVSDRLDAKRWCWTGIWSSAIPVLYGLFQAAASPAILMGDDRLESTFTHPNIFAFFLMGTIALALFMKSSRLMALSYLQHRVLLAYIPALVFLLLLTKTRSAWLATAFLFAGYALVVDRRWLMLVPLAPVVLLVPGVADRLFDLSGGNVDGGYAQLNSYAWRRLLWQSALDWMAQNPSLLIGNGPEMFKAFDPIFFPRGAEAGGVGAHNAFLQIYFEMGLLGLGSFGAIFAMIFRQLYVRARTDLEGSVVMALNCIGYLTVFYSDNLLAYLQYQWFFWFFAAIACASTPRRATQMSKIARPYHIMRQRGQADVLQSHAPFSTRPHPLNHRPPH